MTLHFAQFENLDGWMEAGVLEALRDRGANRTKGLPGRRGRILLCSVVTVLLFLFVNISTIKTSEIWCILAPLGQERQGQSSILAPLSCTLGLIYQF